MFRHTSRKFLPGIQIIPVVSGTKAPAAALPTPKKRPAKPMTACTAAEITVSAQPLPVTCIIKMRRIWVKSAIRDWLLSAKSVQLPQFPMPRTNVIISAEKIFQTGVFLTLLMPQTGHQSSGMSDTLMPNQVLSVSIGTATVGILR